MNTQLGIINHPLAHQIGWMLLHSLWQGGLIGLVFPVLRFALRRRSANARYLAGCLCLALLLATPVLTVVGGSWASPASDAMTLDSSGSSGAGAVVFNTGGAEGSYVAPGANSLSRSGLDFLGQVAPLLAMAWLLGVGFFSVRLTRSAWQVRDLRLKANELVDAAWQEVLRDLQCRLGVSRAVRLLKSGLVEVPTVLGWFRPVILLPATTLSGLTPSQLEAILAHELAHMRRLDYLVNGLQCLVETLMFYHPVAWWISRCIREERENACDDLVVQVCGDRLGYARALATLEGFRAGLPALAFAASGGSLLNRLRRLLGVSKESGPTTLREVSGLVLLGIGLVLIILGVRLLLSPTTYQSTARIRIEPDQTDIPGLEDQRGSARYDPYFIQTELELIQSEVVLGKVIQDLDLNTEWGRKYAGGERLKTSETMALLKSRLNLRPVPNTSLVEIRVFGEKPDEAARIANAIAEAYKAQRFARLEQKGRGSLKALEDRFQEEDEKVKKAQLQVDKLRAGLGINNVLASGASSVVSGENDPAPLLTAETLRKLEGLRIENQTEYVRQETLLARLRELAAGSGPQVLAQALPTAAQDTALSAFLERLGAAEQQLASLTKEYGPQHMEVIKVKSQIEDLQNMIKERVNGIMLGLEAKVFSLSNSLINLNQEVEKATQTDIEAASRSQPYFEAKRNLEELQRFRQVLDMKIASEKVEMSLPKTTMVEIVDMAVPALRPISPNLSRAVALIALGLLLDIAGLLLLTGRPGTGSAPRPA